MDSFVVSRAQFRAHQPSSGSVPIVLDDSERILPARLWAGLWESDFGFQAALQSGLASYGGREWTENGFSEFCARLIADTAASQEKVQRSGKVPGALSILWCRVAFAAMNLNGCDLPGMFANVLLGQSVFQPLANAPRLAVRSLLEKIFSEQALTLATLNELLEFRNGKLRKAA